MKKRFTAILAIVLAALMVIGAMPALAADAGYANMFNSASQAYGTDVEYIDELGLYVAGGRGFYTSPDGINWTLRGGGVADAKVQNYGFAYGGPKGAEYFLIISNSTRTNKTFVIDKYFAGRTTIYTYTDGGEELMLKGVLEWDEYTGKFWCGAALADGTKAGLYYSEGYSFDAEKGRTVMNWTKADTGESALYAENTPYTTAAGMSSVLTSITSDGMGHLVAYGIWAGNLNTDAAYALLNGAGGHTCQSALLVDASGSAVGTRLCDFSKYSTTLGISTAVIDKKSNVFIEDTSFWKVLPFYTGTFSKLWALGNNGQATTYTSSNTSGVMTAIKYAVEPNAYDATRYPNAARVVASSNTTNVLNKIISLDDKALLIPRAGQGIGGNNSISDIFVVTYKADGTPVNRYTPFINNTETAAKAIGDYVNKKLVTYVTDAAAGPDGQVVLMTGRNKKDIASAGKYATTVTVLETKDTVTNSTATDLPDRSSKVAFANTTACEYTYSHVKAADTVINIRPDIEYTLSAQAYDGTVTNTPVEADITYNTASVPAGFDTITGDGVLYAFPECNPGTYKIEVEVFVTDCPAVRNVITYTVNVLGDFTTSINGVYDYNAACARDAGGFAVGSNKITASCNIEDAPADAMAIIAVYKGAELVDCAVDTGSEAAIDFEIAEGDNADAYTYKIMFWTKDLRPL